MNNLNCVIIIPRRRHQYMEPHIKDSFRLVVRFKEQVIDIRIQNNGHLFEASVGRHRHSVSRREQ